MACAVAGRFRGCLRHGGAAGYWLARRAGLDRSPARRPTAAAGRAPSRAASTAPWSSPSTPAAPRPTGEITGATRRGEKFDAKFEGSLNQGFLNAQFEGSGQTGVGLPAGFRGELQGDLEQGEAAGSWNVDLIQVRAHYEGTWAATQIK